MKILVCTSLLTWLLLSSCQPSLQASLAYQVVGSYELLTYRTPVRTHESPQGSLDLTWVDAEHINLRVEGVADTTRFIYAYEQVAVQEKGQNNRAQDCYELVYQTRSIGLVCTDDTSRYIELHPTPTISLQAIEL